jgi:hypothetical protein
MSNRNMLLEYLRNRGSDGPDNVPVVNRISASHERLI